MTGFIALCFFLRAMKLGMTCRVVTTSVAEHHLKVLWGEIGRFLVDCKVPLLVRDSGPLVVNHMEVRRASEVDAKNPLNYLVGRVSEKGEGLAGHHADWTLGIGDEASGIDDKVYEMFQGWASGTPGRRGRGLKRMLFIGNPNPTDNFFKKACKAGDLVVSN